METMLRYLNGETVDTAALRTEIQAEYDRVTEKARANADKYATAIPIVLGVMTPIGNTAAEIYAACANDLPEDFSLSKVQYLLREKLKGKIRVIPNGKNPNTYALM